MKNGPGKNRSSPELKEIDRQIGRRIRVRRIQLGLSQEALGDMLGVTFQQIQKYEKGVNRVSGSRTTQLAHALKVSPAHFFGPDGGNSSGDAEADGAIGLLTLPGALRLMQNYARMPKDMRHALSQLSACMVGPAPQSKEP